MSGKEKRGVDIDSDLVSYGEIPDTLEHVQLGVWRIILERSQPLRWQDVTTRVQAAAVFIAHVVPFIKDVFTVVGTGLSLVFLISKLWAGIEGALSLYLSSNLLSAIESNVTSGKIDPRAVGVALFLRSAAIVAGNVIQWNMERIEPIMQSRLKIHFQNRIMQTHLKLDLPTSQDNSNKFNANAQQAWSAIGHLVELFEVVFSTVSQLAFVVDLAKDHKGGIRLAFLCLVSPIYVLFSKRELWSRVFGIYASNKHYLRAKAFFNIATNAEYKQEVMVNGAEEYITEEFGKAEDALGNVSDDYAFRLFSRTRTPVPVILADFFRDLPLITYAIDCILHPEYFSVASLAMLQQTSESLRWTFYRLKSQKATMAEDLSYIKALYEGVSIPNTIESGDLSYPLDESAEKQVQRGMSIELRDVTFAYPGADSRNVLENISTSIPASSLVVIVGANGSGKSSLVKLLTNLHRPRSGDILIDSHPISAYSTTDLRRATALLTQDHSVFPLNIAENIGLGDPANATDRTRVEEAAKMGGASGFIAKLARKWDEVLFPITTSYASQYPMRPGDLRDVMLRVEKQSDISGGEKQRLVASRTFMRIMSGNIKLLVVDEPTSAMDPQGEFELFERLRGMREGKTTVFVTHRFGHLTKHADLILCMKEGKLVESGTHVELMARNGEYFSLYNIQAQAFTETPLEKNPS